MTTRAKRTVTLAAACAILLLSFVLGRPILHLASVAWHDEKAVLSQRPEGVDDASRLYNLTPGEVIPALQDPQEAAHQIADLVKRAATNHLKIAISGARHSMGGHTLREGAIVLNMLPFRFMAVDEERRVLTVGSGTRWREVIPFLHARGFAIEVMQSNNDFTVGGSISVNCHGWQHRRPPIASTVESFRLVKADGEIVRCSRHQNSELFSLVLGGYGLFGVILDVELRVVSNEFYRPETWHIPAHQYSTRFKEIMENRDDIGMAYGRISIAPDSLLEDAVLVLLQRDGDGNPPHLPLPAASSKTLKRWVFRSGVGSDYGKNLRWSLERHFGQLGAGKVSRNEIMNESFEWFANRTPEATEILHEYFVPVDKLADFLDLIRPLLLEHQPDLLNITVRDVMSDPDSFLRYAREEVFGLVMLFHQKRTEQAEEAMRIFTQAMIDAALECGGAYYLPYRPHATWDQFHRSYPMAGEFFSLKHKYDPQSLFENEFYLKYGRN